MVTGHIRPRELDRDDRRGLPRDGLAGFDFGTLEPSAEVDGPDGPDGLEVIATPTRAGARELGLDDILIFRRASPTPGARRPRVDAAPGVPQTGPMTGPLYLLRHGETFWNREGRMQGGRDSALTPLGRVQAARQGAILRRAGVAAPAWTSPRGRARATAALAGLEARIDPDLAEISMGAWEGEVRPAGPAPGVLWKFGAPGGERQAALIARLRRVLARPGPAILVTHGVVVIGLRALARGLPPEAWDRLTDPQGTVLRLDGRGETALGRMSQVPMPESALH